MTSSRCATASSSICRPKSGWPVMIAASVSAGVAPVERVPAGHHLRQNRTEREEVGARVEVDALVLLRRHVLERAGDDSDFRHKLGRLVFRIVAGVRDPAGQAEVHDLHVAVLSQHDVLGLQVPMEEASVVSDLKGLRYLGRHAQRFRRGDPARGQPRPQRLAGDVLEDEEQRAGLAGRILADLEDLADERVIERGGRGGLAAHARARVGIGGEIVAQYLERDMAIEAWVACPVHDSHAPGPQRIQYFVRTEPVAAGQPHQAPGFYQNPRVSPDYSSRFGERDDSGRRHLSSPQSWRLAASYPIRIRCSIELLEKSSRPKGPPNERDGL